jgi:hypothetical protein
MQAVGGASDFLAAAIRARERNRHLGRPIARRSVGSTLLLKGLEADVSVILHPELMTAQNGRHERIALQEEGDWTD